MKLQLATSAEGLSFLQIFWCIEFWSYFFSCRVEQPSVFTTPLVLQSLDICEEHFRIHTLYARHHAHVCTPPRCMHATTEWRRWWRRGWQGLGWGPGMWASGVQGWGSSSGLGPLGDGGGGGALVTAFPRPGLRRAEVTGPVMETECRPQARCGKGPPASRGGPTER